MPIIDRYIITVFIKIFLICFLSFAGLYVVVDAFTNLEELLGMAEAESLASVVSGYYGPRVLQFFDKTAAFMALIAAIFSLALMQRANELTAIQAGGISNRRIARPVLTITVAVLLLAVVNREVLIPKYRNQLAMNAQDLMGAERRASMITDPKTGVAIRGQEVTPVNQTITQPEFTVPKHWNVPGHTIAAESGVWLPQTPERAAGYLLENPGEPDGGFAKNITDEKGTVLVYAPVETKWLESNQLFVVASVDTVHLAYPSQLARNASMSEMITSIRRPGTGFSNRLRVDAHGRIVQPAFDLTVLLIGLPLVIARGERNFYLSAGICLCVVMFMSLTFIACQALGASRIISSPAFAAWLPLILFFPFAWVTYGWLSRS